jgi:hypothetical protein
MDGDGECSRGYDLHDVHVRVFQPGVERYGKTVKRCFGGAVMGYPWGGEEGETRCYGDEP